MVGSANIQAVRISKTGGSYINQIEWSLHSPLTLCRLWNSRLVHKAKPNERRGFQFINNSVNIIHYYCRGQDKRGHININFQFICFLWYFRISFWNSRWFFSCPIPIRYNVLAITDFLFLVFVTVTVIVTKFQNIPELSQSQVTQNVENRVLHI